MRDTRTKLIAAGFALNLAGFIVNTVLITTIGSINNMRMNDISYQIEEVRSEIPKTVENKVIFVAQSEGKVEEIDIENLEDADVILVEDNVVEPVVKNYIPENPSKERLPSGIDTNRYDCEDYHFGAGSGQARLQESCWTDRNGLRYFYHDGTVFYCVAMGGAYGIDLGDSWFVTLECGTRFGIILSDYQHSIENVDPDDFGERYDSNGDILLNYDGEPVVHVLEFVVDMSLLNRDILRAGTVSALEEFGGAFGDGGNIIDISYNGRIWE